MTTPKRRSRPATTQFTEAAPARRPHTATRRASAKRAAPATRNDVTRDLALSRERVEKLARDLVDTMSRSDAVKFLKDRDAVREAIAHALADELRREQEREETVRKRMAAMRHAPRRGSQEWEQLFRALMNEEYVRDSEG